MAGLIKVTPELLEGEAKKVSGCNDEFRTTTDKLKQIVANLKEVWEGQAQAAFEADFENMKKTITSFSACLDRYSEAMKTAARELKQADETLKSKMSGSSVG